MTFVHRCLLVVAISAAWLPAAWAQTASAEDRLRSALRDTTRRLHESQDEIATLRAELTSVKQQMAQKATPRSCPPVADFSPRARRQMENLAAENEALRRHAEEAQKVVSQWQEAQTQWQAGLQQAAQQAQVNESAAKGLQEQLQLSAERERDCAGKNAQLVKISSELLDRYRDKGLWDLFRRAEPITQISRVRFEALQQEYRDKIIVNEVLNNPNEVQHGNQP